MGANDRLMHAAQNAGIDRFILRQAMGRGQWAPKCLDLWIKDDDGTKTFIPLDEELLSDKVCADLVEGILGVVYLEHGYEASFKVADELGLTLPGQVEDSGTSSDFGPARRREQQELVAMAENFLGKKTFSHPELLEEALTHSTAINQDVPSYQKLEWIGDAVLCLAAREWIYTHYPKLDVAELVVMEATLVSNETLAHLSIMNNLEKFIRHRDVTLPGRIREFIDCIGNSERGLWGTGETVFFSMFFILFYASSLIALSFQ
jgi:dsRNA-specific ribonuclease